MKLRQNEIEIISNHITNALLAGEYIVADEEKLKDDIARVIHDDLAVEDNLNEEVRKMLTDHKFEIEKSNMEYHQIFNMVKAKLIKERNLVL